VVGIVGPLPERIPAGEATPHPLANSIVAAHEPDRAAPPGCHGPGQDIRRIIIHTSRKTCGAGALGFEPTGEETRHAFRDRVACDGPHAEVPRVSLAEWPRLVE
jgi:hypothetical protein